MKEIRVPFKKNFNFWTFVSIVQIVYLIFNYHDYSIFEISYISLIFVFLNIYNLQKNREYYKKIIEYDLKQDEIRLAEEKLELEQSRILENKYLTITVNPESKQIHFFSYTNDYLSNFQRLEDYRLEDKELYIKCKHSKYVDTENNRIVNLIINSVVQESNVIDFENNQRDKLLMYQGNEIAEKINELKKSTEWNIVNNYRIRYFVLFHHKNEIPNLKNYYISERDRIRGGFLNYKNYLKSQDNSLEIKNYSGYYHVYFDSNKPEEENKLIIDKIYSDLINYKLTYEEFSNSRRISMFLYILISRLE
jgi:hypothetical protein